MKRGRKSAASLQIVASNVEIVPRIPAPDELSDAETDIWVSVIDTMPADWFDNASLPLLKQYCRHVVQAKNVSAMIANLGSSVDLDDYDKLLKMQERESRAVSALARSMRISQQSTSNHRGNKQKTLVKKPWDD